MDDVFVFVRSGTLDTSEAIVIFQGSRAEGPHKLPPVCDILKDLIRHVLHGALTVHVG